MSTEDTATERGRRRLTADSGVIVLLLLLGVMGYAMTARLVDGLRITYDPLARPMMTSDSSLRTLVGVGLLVVAVGLAAAVALRRRAQARPVPFVLLLQALVVWWCLMSVLAPRGAGAATLLTLGALPLVFAVVTAPPGASSLRLIQLALDVFCVAGVLYSFANPELAQFACRDDKCGVMGSLYSGFFTQENVAPNLVALFLPVAIAARSDSRALVSVLLASSVALTSGSRTGVVSIALAAALVFACRWVLRRKDAVHVPSAVLAIPLLFGVAGLVVFVVAGPGDLTGRGLVYRVIREALSGPAMIYGAPWDTVEAGTDGYLSGEHGQIAHVVARAGLVGLVLWFLALVALLRERHMGRHQLIGLAILLTASIGMITEPRLELDVRSGSFAALLLVVGLMSASPPLTAPHSARRPLTRTRRALVTVCLVGAALVPAMLPRVHTAQVPVFLTSRASWASELVSTYEIARIKSRSYHELSLDGATLSALSERLGVSTEPGLLGSLLDARLDDRATMLRLSAEHTDSATAAALVETWADIVVARASELENRGPGTPPQAQAVRVGDAVVTERNPWLSNGGVSLVLALAALHLLEVGRTPRERAGDV